MVGFAAGVVMGAAGMDIASMTLVGQILGFIVSLPVSFATYRWSVEKFIL